MELNNNDAAVCTDSINAQAGTASADEIDLYDELIAFAELSPEEQLRLVSRPEKASAETAKASAEQGGEQTSPEPVLTHAPVEPIKHTAGEPVVTLPRIKPVDTDATVPAAASASDSEVSKAYVESSEVRPRQVEGPRPSGPLSGFNLPPDIVYTGALSRGVCVACGAESDADDLFCITCGVFADAIGSSRPANPTCAECKRVMSTDDIFCPWCGSVPPAA